MTEVINIVNSLIYKARENENIKNVKFVKAYRENFAQNPVEGYIAVVKIEKISKTNSFAGGFADSKIKGEMFSVCFALSVYSDNDITGEELSSTALKIQQAVADADESSIIESSWISPIEFDSDIKAIYREINFTLAFCLCGDE